MSHPFSTLRWTETGTTPVNPHDPHTVRNAVDSLMDAQALPLFAGPAPSWQANDVAEPATAPAEEIDWATVRQLQSSTAEQVREASERYEAEHGRAPDREEVQVLAAPLISQVVERWARRADMANEITLRPQLLQAYSKAVRDSLYGLGRMQHLLEIEDAENIIISGASPVIVEHNDGRYSELPPVADSAQDLMDQLQHMAQSSIPRRAFDANHLDMTLMHRERFRIHAVSNEISLQPSVVIRQHLMTQISLGDLADRGMMPLPLAELLDQAVQAGKTIVVAGEQGVGKTTLLRALIHAIPMYERFGTLETDLELFAHRMPGREHTLVMFARDGMGEKDASGRRSGEVEVSDMVRPALRQGLRRIIVGEVRGVEASAMFQAMQSGTGTMSSIHSPNAQQVPNRLADVVAQGGVYSISEARRQIAQSVSLIVFIRRRDNDQHGRRRWIESVRWINPGEHGEPSEQSIYEADPWSGETISFTPGELGSELAHLRRDLDRLEKR